MISWVYLSLPGDARWWLFVIVSSLVTCLLRRPYLASLRPKNFPPGPVGLPFFGNIAQIPRARSFLKFQRWQGQYGSIIGLKVASQNLVVLNSHKHVKALLDLRGGIYSSRPQSYIVNELLCPGEIHVLLLEYGSEWRKQRRILQAILSEKEANKMLPLQEAEVSQTMLQLMEDPDGYYDHVRRYTTAVILASIYSQRGPRFESPIIQAFYHTMDRFTEILEPGAVPPIESFPFLKHIPQLLAPWRVKVEAVRKEQQSLYHRLLQETKRRLASGKARGCFLETLIQKQQKNDMDDEHIAYLAGVLMEGGSDTTASTLLSFLLAMTKYPQEFRKAQEEVDRVCGTSRSPAASDISHLPFIKACMDETLRWRPVAPVGVAHALTCDDVYEGYFLPKDTVILTNTWAIHHDEDEYELPNRFMPDRFLNNPYGTCTPIDSAVSNHRRTTYAFGAGRRSCPGHWVAKNALMLSMAKLAWAFDLSSLSDDLDDDIDTAYHTGILIAPKRFPISITPRSEGHRIVIEREYHSIEPFLNQYER